jgi:hypothetical protein
MGLSDRAKAARAKADATGHPYDVALATALEATEAAELERIKHELFPMQECDPPPSPPPIDHVRVWKAWVEN